MPLASDAHSHGGENEGAWFRHPTDRRPSADAAQAPLRSPQILMLKTLTLSLNVIQKSRQTQKWSRTEDQETGGAASFRRR
jgi:hypothetical protein